MAKLQNIKARILSNKEFGPGYFHMILEAGHIEKIAQPGQFLQIKVNDLYEPLLRRPFSVHRITSYKSKVKSKKSKIKSQLEILYEVVGRSTKILSQKSSGEFLDVIGPLGNGFGYPLNLSRHQADAIPASPALGFAERRAGGPASPALGFAERRAGGRYSLLVAGGMGVAPLIFLAEKLTEIKNQKSKIKNLVLIGAKTKDQILCEKEFKSLGCDIRIATDDGSYGFKGKVTALLTHLLSTINYQPASPVGGPASPVGGPASPVGGPSTVYACGPTPMLKAVSKVVALHNINCQISLEAHMSCGIGACMGCVIKIRNTETNNSFQYKRVCKDGPVFNAQDIIWE